MKKRKKRGYRGKFKKKFNRDHTNGWHHHHHEFQNYHKQLKYYKPFALVFSLIILYLIFQWLGVHIITVFFAMIITIREISQIYFVWKLEKRVMQPINDLQKGVQEITKGNYDVRVETEVDNEIGVLIASFNEMVQRLEESEKMNRTYEENRKQLIANITHDLKTPIASIQGYMEGICEGVVTSQDDIERYNKVILSNTVYMNKLIDDLFLFSKLDMDKLEFDKQEINISAYMDDLMQEFEFEVEDKGYDFKYINKTKRDYIVEMDSKRIHQAIRNIIGNAVKYGGEDLKVGVELYDNDNFICLDIKDNGCGIPKEKLPYIFDRFYRIDNERTKDVMSTGLGLAIAKELIKAHEGDISVSSTENVGTCFTICIPIFKERRI